MELTVNQLSKKFNGRIVLDDISCRVRAGQSFVVTGPNGSGKSTLLKLICGLLRPTKGTVELSAGGKKLDREEMKRSIGYAAPDMNLYDRLTAFENLDFFSVLRRLPRDPGAITGLLEDLQLQDMIHRPVSHFSSGMKQRLNLAYALLHNPSVLILDEPTANLDQRGKQLLAQIIAGRRNKGICIIATNEPEEVTRFGQQVLRLGLLPGSPG